MDRKDAEEFTESLGLIAHGGWRQAALGERLGVPEALGMTTRDWIQERLGGYLKLSVTHRREAVGELSEEGMSKDAIADVLGVGEATVGRDRRGNGAVSNDTPQQPKQPDPEPAAVSNDTLQPPPVREIACPQCNGTGWIPLSEGEAA